MATRKITKAQKQLLNELAHALIASEIEQHIIQPAVEKETGLPYDKETGYVATYLDKTPNVKQTWKAFQQEMKKVRNAVQYEFELDRKQNANSGSRHDRA